MAASNESGYEIIRNVGGVVSNGQSAYGAANMQYGEMAAKISM